MNFFTVLYIAPVETLKEWMQKPEAERKDADTKMRQDWDTWMAAHKDAVLNTVAFGPTKRVSKNDVEDLNNGIMLSSYVTAESLEAVAELFKDHPHLGIPGATIEIMPVRQMEEAGA